MSNLPESNGEVGAVYPRAVLSSTNYKVISDNHCPFCGKGDLEPCECFANTSSNGKIKPECEGCSG